MRLADRLPAEPVWPETEAERGLAGIWRAVLRCGDVLASDSFLGLGGNSITSLQVVAKAAAMDMTITSREVIEAASLRELAALAQATARPVVEERPDLAVGEVTLTPIQRWFFGQDFAEPHQWDQAVVVETVARLDPDVLEAAIEAVVAHHDVLRSRFRRKDEAWTQVVGSVAMAAVRTIPACGESAAQLDEAIAAARDSIDMSSGPLVAAVLLDGEGAQPGRLLLAVHHLVVDGVSMRILIEDLDVAYRARRDGVPVSLPRRTSSFRSWSRELRRFAESDELAEQLPYWSSGVARYDPMRGWGQAESNLQRDREVLSAEVGAELSQKILRHIPRHGAFSVESVLIAGLAVAWQRERGVRGLALDLEGHGREPISSNVDVSRTVGWFTSIYPVVLTLPDGQDLAGALASVADTLDGVPSRGLGYGVLRYLSSRGTELSQQESPSISFNYLGSFAGPADESRVLGASAQLPMVLTSEHARRPYLLEVAVADVDGRLLIRWEYGPGDLTGDLASALVARHVAAIGQLADAALALPVGSRRANEFQLARVSADELTAIRDRLANGRRS
jgi:non-ribosomal peptide synthase protein (TIGR01720 family)